MSFLSHINILKKKVGTIVTRPIEQTKGHCSHCAFAHSCFLYIDMCGFIWCEKEIS